MHEFGARRLFIFMYRWYERVDLHAAWPRPNRRASRYLALSSVLGEINVAGAITAIPYFLVAGAPKARIWNACYAGSTRYCPRASRRRAVQASHDTAAPWFSCRT